MKLLQCGVELLIVNQTFYPFVITVANLSTTHGCSMLCVSPPQILDAIIMEWDFLYFIISFTPNLVLLALTL